MKRTLFLMMSLAALVFAPSAKAEVERFLPEKADVVFLMQADKLLTSPLFSATQAVFDFLTALGGETVDPADVLRSLKAKEALGVIVEEEWAVVIRFEDGAGVEPFLAQNEPRFIRMKTPSGLVFRRLKLDKDTCFHQPTKDTLLLCSENMFPYLDGRKQATGASVRETLKRFSGSNSSPLWLVVPSVGKYHLNAESAFFSYGWDDAGHHFKGDVECRDPKTATQNAALLPMMVQLIAATLFNGDPQLMQDVCMLIRATPRGKQVKMALDLDPAMVKRITSYGTTVLKTEMQEIPVGKQNAPAGTQNVPAGK